MTVVELILKLQEIKDKDKQVVIHDTDAGDYYSISEISEDHAWVYEKSSPKTSGYKDVVTIF